MRVDDNFGVVARALMVLVAASYEGGGHALTDIGHHCCYVGGYAELREEVCFRVYGAGLVELPFKKSY